MAHAPGCGFFTPHCIDCNYCLTKYTGKIGWGGGPYCDRCFRRRLGLRKKHHGKRRRW